MCRTSGCLLAGGRCHETGVGSGYKDKAQRPIRGDGHGAYQHIGMPGACHSQAAPGRETCSVSHRGKYRAQRGLSGWREVDDRNTRVAGNGSALLPQAQGERSGPNLRRRDRQPAAQVAASDQSGNGRGGCNRCNPARRRCCSRAGFGSSARWPARSRRPPRLPAVAGQPASPGPHGR